jgi:hypothetical protein
VKLKRFRTERREHLGEHFPGISRHHDRLRHHPNALKS